MHAHGGTIGMRMLPQNLPAILSALAGLNVIEIACIECGCNTTRNFI